MTQNLKSFAETTAVGHIARPLERPYEHRLAEACLTHSSSMGRPR
jgi:hypothetical protein